MLVRPGRYRAALGLAPSLYSEHTVKLEPGAKLLLYTDGITEAMDRRDEE
jgi:serine phosphatase RsbU (regulator of sigma subunit)